MISSAVPAVLAGSKMRRRTRTSSSSSFVQRTSARERVVSPPLPIASRLNSMTPAASGRFRLEQASICASVAEAPSNSGANTSEAFAEWTGFPRTAPSTQKKAPARATRERREVRKRIESNRISSRVFTLTTRRRGSTKAPGPSTQCGRKNPTPHASESDVRAKPADYHLPSPAVEIASLKTRPQRVQRSGCLSSHESHESAPGRGSAGRERVPSGIPRPTRRTRVSGSANRARARRSARESRSPRPNSNN